jgi:hypothetical protein
VTKKTAQRSVKKLVKKSKELSVEEKYDLYEGSVQNPQGDIEFLNKEFKRIFKRKALKLREDFSGTGQLCCEWAKQSPKHMAYAVDIDREPQQIGLERHWGKLTTAQKERVIYLEGDVLEKRNFKAELIVAFNFSYFIFKERNTLLHYFKRCYQGLESEGMFALDIFGGTEGFQELVEQTQFPHHTYFWDCKSYNPLTAEVQYGIHFKKNGHKYEDVFQYDWRMWQPREIEDLLLEAGFKTVDLYWEGEEKDGSGNGEFYPSRVAENCCSWVSYIVATKR